jgi:hypothetical protein
MRGPYYVDSLPPWLVTDVGAVTLAATNKALYPAAAHPNLGGNFFGFPGAGLRIRMFGRMTTGATPGNGQFAVYWGNGGDANGTILASSAALALVINGSNLSWCAEFDIVCRSVGATGTLFVTGWTEFNVGLLASTNAPMLVPGATPVVSGAVDLSANNVISVQFNRSGSTAESMQIHDLWFHPLN